MKGQPESNLFENFLEEHDLKMQSHKNYGWLQNLNIVLVVLMIVIVYAISRNP